MDGNRICLNENIGVIYSYGPFTACTLFMFQHVQYVITFFLVPLSFIIYKHDNVRSILNLPVKKDIQNKKTWIVWEAKGFSKIISWWRLSILSSGYQVIDSKHSVM